MVKCQQEFSINCLFLSTIHARNNHEKKAPQGSPYSHFFFLNHHRQMITIITEINSTAG